MKPTPKQKKVAQAIIENSQSEQPTTAGIILDNIGYSKSIVKNPQMIMESDGVKQALVDLGFHEDNAKRVVADILNKSEDNNRLKAADMIFKVSGSYAPEKHLSVQVKGDVKDFQKHKELVDKFENELLAQYQNE